MDGSLETFQGSRTGPFTDAQNHALDYLMFGWKRIATFWPFRTRRRDFTISALSLLWTPKT